MIGLRRHGVVLLTVLLLSGCGISRLPGRAPSRLSVPSLPDLRSVAGAPAPAGLPKVPLQAPRADLQPYRSAHAGPLPTATTAALAGVPIPGGAPVRATAGASHGATLWISAAPVPAVGALVARLITVFPRTGLWPVVIDTTEPGLSDDFDPSQTGSPDAIPDQAFSRWWRANMGSGSNVDSFAAAVFGTEFPGLQIPGGSLDPTALDGVLSTLKGKLGLVSLTRPADLAAVTGWEGATNYLNPGEVTVALRSWEDRYAVEPVALGFDFLVMGVGNSPEGAIASLDLAAEQFAVCPDQLEQGAYAGIEEYATTLDFARRLDCWWD